MLNRFAARRFPRLFAALVLTSTCVVSAPASALEVLVLGGGTGTTKSQYYYVGAVMPISSTLATDGARLRLWSAYKHFEYTGGARNSNITVSGPELEAMVGYNYSFSAESKVTAYLGAVWRDLSPSQADPSRSHDHDTMPKIQLEGSTRFGKVHLNAIGSYVFGSNDHWVRFRPAFFVNDKLNMGPEFVTLGGRGYDKQQLGFFIDGIHLGINKSSSFFSEGIGLRLGAERDSRKNSLRPYIGASFALHF